MTDSPPISPAATVLLVRDAEGGLEVLLVRRNAKLAFHGGSWVFPGGRIDAADYPGAEPPAELDHPDHEVAARTAACREVREEAGLAVASGALIPFSHWTTPVERPRRFATSFFIVEAPPGAVAVDGSEIHDHSWMRPADALGAQERREIDLPPPTFVSLVHLTASATASDALAASRCRPYVRFEPRLRPIPGGFVSVYAGDVAYDEPDRLDEPAPRHRLWPVESGWRYERRA